MNEFQRKQIIKTLVYSKFTLVILFLAFILILRSVMDLNDKRINSKKIKEEVFAKKEVLLEKRNELFERNEYIKTDKGKEEYIRTTYPVVRGDGEGVVVIFDDKKGVVTDVRSDMNVWERIFVWIKGKMFE